ncbi:MAG: hypothetical protein JO072_01220 [Parafilimonas sp.]|nr:hypothetical protein [Parafilimonas sp.]
MAKEKHQIVTVERDWKEYLGECLLIVFSVALAIGVTEYFNNLHDKNKDHEILRQLKDELIANKDDAQDQYAYHLQVFKLIDSAQSNPAFAKKFLDSGRIHLGVIMPKGAIRHDLKDVAWQLAKQNDVISKIDYDTYSLLASTYSNQEKMSNLEPSIEKILISYESRKPENLETTLTLIHDALYGWVVERTPELLEKYQQAINALSKY